MMKKTIIALSFFALLLSPIFADEITFSGGESIVTLKDGREEVTLTGGAEVTVGTLKIESDEIILRGKDWNEITCRGRVSITDSERGISINTSSIWYDRTDERLVINTYFELSDTESEMTATASNLEYRMDDEMLTLSKGVRLSKVDGDETIRCTSEKMTYSRTDELVELRGRAKVTFKGNDYEAEAISLDVKNDRIELSDKIRGKIDG